jgi:hypothetical protein
MIPMGMGALLCWLILSYDEREQTINRRNNTTTMHTPRRLASKFIIIVVAAGLLAFAAILLTPSSSPAEPVISWTPKLVIENIRHYRV